jgi:hypothetical protein
LKNDTAKKEDKKKDSLELIKDFKQSYDFAIFAFNYDQERTLKERGRDE